MNVHTKMAGPGLLALACWGLYESVTNLRVCTKYEVKCNAVMTFPLPLFRKAFCYSHLHALYTMDKSKLAYIGYKTASSLFNAIHPAIRGKRSNQPGTHNSASPPS